MHRNHKNHLSMESMEAEVNRYFKTLCLLVCWPKYPEHAAVLQSYTFVLWLSLCLTAAVKCWTLPIIHFMFGSVHAVKSIQSWITFCTRVLLELDQDHLADAERLLRSRCCIHACINEPHGRVKHTRVQFIA